ncbi:MAG: TonB-dependent receptor [Methylophaga sp.]|nr:MAG: TonB-dependent receptor [Methylophaga sp.]
MFSIRKLSLLIALTGVSTLSAVQAETSLELDELVVTGTRSETSLLDLAGNTGKINEAEIDLVRADHIEEIINRVSGVMIQRGNGQEHLTAIRSPVLTGGAGAGSFLFLQDGIPLRAAGFANVNGLFEASSEQAGSIEVIRGPGSALYGSNAVHGLVNVITRAPSLELERSIDVSAGPHDLYRFKGTVSNTEGAHGYRLSINTTTDGGYIDDSGFDQQKLNFRHDYSGDVDSVTTIFTATNLNQETAGYTEGLDAYRDTGQTKATNTNPEAYRDAKSARLSVRWDHELTDNSYFTITPYVRHTELDFLMHFLPGTPVEQNEHKSVGLLSSYTNEFGEGHKIIVGTDLEYTRGKLSEFQQGPTVFGRFVQGEHYNYEIDATVVAPYIHSEWQLAEKTRMTVGARFEHTRYEYDNKTTGGTVVAGGTVVGAFQRPNDRSDTFNNFSPKLGFVYELADDTSIFTNLARGNRAPQTTDLYRIRNTQNGVEADSEKVDSIELGIRKVGSGIQYEMTTYFMKKKDHFFRDSTGENIPNGKTQHYGIELSAFIPFAEQFDIAGNFTYARHRYDFDNVGTDPNGSNSIRDGDDIDSAPRHIGNLRLGWNVRPQSRLELEWLHVGRYYTDSGNVHSYDGHDLLNLRAQHKVNNQLTLHGKISNLLNTDYAERADYNYVNTFNNTDRYFVGEQGAVHVGMTYDF